ncbi:MAG: hypothetical protein RJA70_3966 [Pseudomonadota bacterium]
MIACSDDDDSAEECEEGCVTTADIGKDGGEVSSGDAAVKIPRGALANEIEVSVGEATELKAVAPKGYELVGPAIAFTPHGTKFAKDVTLTLPYESKATKLVVLRLDDEDDRTWEVVTGGAFKSGDATIAVKSFSVYAVAEGEAAKPPVDKDAGVTPPAEFDCQTICETAAAQKCKNESSLKECVKECSEGLALFSQICNKEFMAVMTCAQGAKWECDADGEAAPAGDACAEEAEALNACFEALVGPVEGDAGAGDAGAGDGGGIANSVAADSGLIPADAAAL